MKLGIFQNITFWSLRNFSCWANFWPLKNEIHVRAKFFHTWLETLTSVEDRNFSLVGGLLTMFTNSKDSLEPWGPCSCNEMKLN